MSHFAHAELMPMSQPCPPTRYVVFCFSQLCAVHPSSTCRIVLMLSSRPSHGNIYPPSMIVAHPPCPSHSYVLSTHQVCRISLNMPNSRPHPPAKHVAFPPYPYLTAMSTYQVCCVLLMPISRPHPHTKHVAFSTCTSHSLLHPSSMSLVH